VITTEDKGIQSLVEDIRDGRLLLPEMQRAYVWDSTQVRDFFDSLYHNYPSGQLLVWDTDDLPFSRTLGVSGVAAADRRPRLLLDGQQRMTSLAAVMLGNPLHVRWRTRAIDIVFNVYDPKFEVASAAHHAQAGWVSLTRLFTQGAATILRDLKLEFGTPEGDAAYERINALDNIRSYKYRLNVLEGLNYEEVTHIFVRINSGGTKLNSADLALAQVSSRWRGVTEKFDNYLYQIRQRGWELDNSVLLRVMTALLTNQSRLSQLFRSGREHLGVEELKAAWERAKPAITQSIDFLVQNCLIDRLSMMPTNYVLVPLAIFFDRYGRSVTEQQSRDLRRWLYMALMWSRYTGPTETNLDQDIAALLREKDQPIQRMIQNIEDKVGKRPVTERELQDQLSNSPYMLMAYVLARRAHAQDWFNGVAIGGNQTLEYHHIFPKALLKTRYDLRQDSRVINQVANLAFLSARANGRISSQAPSEYLSTIEPSRLVAQNVPIDSGLWTLDQFEEFVLRRRMQLANEINSMLQSLSDTPTAWATNSQTLLGSHIDTLEDVMRQVIRSRLERENGALAWKRGMPGDTRANVEQRIAQRVKQYPYEADQYHTLEAKLEHCQFSDYFQIVNYNWRLFEDVFGQKPKFEQMFTPALNARNAIKHNRTMDDSEVKIAEGASEWLERCLRDAIRRDTTESEADEADQEDDTLLGSDDDMAVGK
jgi:hypothetical protein